jgi:hypothetical protein
LRLRDFGVASVIICPYVNVESAAPGGLLRIAEAKLFAAHKAIDGRFHWRH